MERHEGKLTEEHRHMSSGRSRRAALLVLVVGILAITACTEQPEPFSVPSSSSSSVESPLPTPTSSVLPSVPSPSVNLLDWQVVVPGDPGFPSFGPVTDQWVVARYNGDDSSTRIVTYLPDGSAATLSIDDGIVQEVIQVADSLVFGVGSDATGMFKLVAWNPSSGESTVLIEGDTWSEYALNGTDLYYTWPGQPGEHCVRVVGLDDPMNFQDDRVVTCVGPETDIGWVKSDASAVSFMTRDQGEECWRINYVDSANSEVVRIEVPGCVVRGVYGEGTPVWNEATQGEDTDTFFHTELRALSAQGAVSLGDATAGSQTWCDGALYWLTERNPPNLMHSEIRRWRAGSAVETVYVSPDGDASRSETYSTSGPQCDDSGRVFVQRLGWWPGAGDELLATPGLDWSPGVDVAERRPT